MGYFGADLPGMIVDPVPFTTNAAEVAALEGGQLDAAYMDPVAAVSAWQSSPGGLIKVIAGAASGGAELVVRSGITSARQLAHAPVAAPAGGAQQAALDAWLRQQGQSSPGAGHITMTSSYLVRELKAGHIAGAWEPAPQDAQMVAAGGHVLVNEASLWPGGRFATEVLVVTQRYLSAHPEAVNGLLKGHIQAENLITTTPASAAQAVIRSWPPGRAAACRPRCWPSRSARSPSPRTRWLPRSWPRPATPRRPGCSSRSMSSTGYTS